MLFLKKTGSLQKEMKNLCNIQMDLVRIFHYNIYASILPFKNDWHYFYRKFHVLGEKFSSQPAVPFLGNIISNVTFNFDKPRYKW